MTTTVNRVLSADASSPVEAALWMLPVRVRVTTQVWGRHPCPAVWQASLPASPEQLRPATSHDRRDQTKNFRGFTLIELLAVTAVIGILAGLLLPALSQAKGRAQSVKCLNHFKQLGLATLIYTDENQDKVQLHFPGAPEQTWGSSLSTRQHLTASNLFVCPSYPPKKFKDWRRIYGIRLDPPPEYVSGGFDEILHLGKIRAPSDYLHLADTSSRGRGGFGAEQFYYFLTSEKQVHARHQGRANGLFLDGHAEGARRKQLESLGIDALYARDEIPPYY